MAQQYRHIFLAESGDAEEFTTPRRGGPQKIPSRNREAQRIKLQKQWAAIWAKAKERDKERSAVSMPTKDGVYVEFEGAPNYDLVTKSLEDRRAGIRLLNVYTIRDEETPPTEITRATVFIPAGKEEYFLKKVREYAEEETKKGNPKNARVVQSVENVRLAVLESFWRDPPDLMPKPKTAAWCEIWLRGDDPGVETAFRNTAETLRMEVRRRVLRFPERTVVLAKATRDHLSELIESSSLIAEFRLAKETARFFLELENKDQTAWVKDLAARLIIPSDSDVSVCILDTGANNGHQLLKPVLADEDRHCVEPRWGVDDHDGHGTLMCGVAAYGDLQHALQTTGPVEVRHRLASSKIVPPDGKNDPDLYGDVTIQGMSRAAIQAPQREHIGCMAITSADNRDRGRPSSWSGAIDKYTSGYEDDVRRLFIVSAGNVEEYDEWADYPASNKTNSVHDPAQAWNALTVGAYTEKTTLTAPGLDGHVPLAKPAELSPFSTTSLTWESKWPTKPDIVLEGGNLAKAPDGLLSEHDDLSVISTGYQPTKRQFDSINATSAAAAQASWMAAMIKVAYPEAWPETVRALLVHCAEWPEPLMKQFLTADAKGNYSKTDLARLLRLCGYGVPVLARTLACAANSLTLIAQTEIQPYQKKKGSSTCSTKDMHVHRLPWPKDILLSLGEIPVTLRVTLSYFVEPSPGEVGWRDKYRYASHGLRFDLNKPGEDEGALMQRLNAAARDEGEQPDTDGGSDRWQIGSQGRSSGSIHSDIWKGTAADIATCNLVGIYPVGGWWRERPWIERWDRKARYSLLVSLYTPAENVNIYVPVANQVGIAVPIEYRRG